MKKFYNFANETEESVDLFISGEIVDDDDQALTRAFLGEEIGTNPGSFIAKLQENDGKHINVYIDSYGGLTSAASSIYAALKEHKGGVTVKITGVAASAASVIAMAGDKVLMAKTAIMMIHNPLVCTYGDHNDHAKSIEVLEKVKESIINAYESKTGLPREKISDLMEKETWMSYNDALNYGFCDGEIGEDSVKNVVKNCLENRIFVFNSLYKNAKNSADILTKKKADNEEDADASAAEKLKNEQMQRYLDLLMRS